MNKDKRRRQLMKEERRKLRRGEVAHAKQPSPPKAPRLSESQEFPADSIKRLEQFDSHAHLRNRLREIALEKGEWAGIPMPLEKEELVVERGYPFAEALMKMGARDTPPGYEDLGDKAKLRNSWHDMRRRCDVYVYEKDGKIDWGYRPAFHGLTYQLTTLGCSDAWGIEQEARAVQTFAGIVTHRQFRLYMLTGSFLERSHRSGVTYMFRKLRPTIAVVPDKGGGTRILACLCMHPIAYYHGSWAGAMCPTDDVIAHLQMMRGDEAMFWKRSNQHPAWRPEAGL